MHAGLNLPNSHELSPGGREAAAAAGDLMRLGDLPASAPAEVAIVYDYEAHWVAAIQPHGADFRYPELVFRWYEAIRRLGLDVDFVPPGASLDRYRLVLAPSLPIVSASAEAAFAAAKGLVVFGPRSGSKTRHFSIPEELPPGPLQRLLRSRVIEVSSLRPGAKIEIQGAISGYAERWRELVETSAETLATFADNSPALVGNDNYLLSGLLARRRRAPHADGAIVPKGGPLDDRAAGRSAITPPWRSHLCLQLRRDVLAGPVRRRTADRRRLRGSAQLQRVANLTRRQSPVNRVASKGGLLIGPRRCRGSAPRSPTRSPSRTEIAGGCARGGRSTSRWPSS